MTGGSLARESLLLRPPRAKVWRAYPATVLAEVAGGSVETAWLLLLRPELGAALSPWLPGVVWTNHLGCGAPLLSTVTRHLTSYSTKYNMPIWEIFSRRVGLQLLILMHCVLAFKIFKFYQMAAPLVSTENNQNQSLALAA